MVPGESAGFCVSGPRDIGPVCILCLPNVGQACSAGSASVSYLATGLESSNLKFF